MKKQTILLFILALSHMASAQSYFNPSNGHTYIKLGKASLASAREQAQQLGGHLLVVNDASEYSFVDSNLIRRGDGWTWTGVAECSDMWQVDCTWDYSVWKQLNNHWLPTFQINVVNPDAVISAGKFQATYRSTKWVTKFGPPLLSTANVVVEIE